MVPYMTDRELKLLCFAPLQPLTCSRASSLKGGGRHGGYPTQPLQNGRAWMEGHRVILTT